MIELGGWIFDFENMRAVDYNNTSFRLMKLNNEFYIQSEFSAVNHSMMLNVKPSWHWPRFQFTVPEHPDAVGEAYSKEMNKKITEAYLTWCIESTVFGLT